MDDRREFPRYAHVCGDGSAGDVLADSSGKVFWTELAEVAVDFSDRALFFGGSDGGRYHHYGFGLAEVCGGKFWRRCAGDGADDQGDPGRGLDGGDDFRGCDRSSDC